MFSPSTGIAILVLYAAVVFSIASWVERKAAAGTNIGNNAYIYALSFAVYLTAWSFYGQVGRAASSGMLYLASHLGATLSVVLWWTILRKMVRIRHAYRITSIADFISLRYDKSQRIAAIATVIAIVGIVPYLALQLKAVISTFEIIVRLPGAEGPYRAAGHIGLLIAGFMVLFTILFGVRRLVPTERHQGMVVAIAAESVLKLLAFLTVGIFATYFLFHGFGDIFGQFSASPLSKSMPGKPALPVIFSWITNLLMAMSAVTFVPALFHIMVVENFHENHIRTSMWLFPLFMFLMSIFTLPIAMGGLLMGRPLQQADNFVLTLPLLSGHAWLMLLAFLGGLSAAMGFLVVNAVTLSTMFTNHILLPIFESVSPLGFLKRYLLQCRWVAVATFILASYWFQREVVQSSMLAEMGVSAFAAVLQFAPTLMGGLFWKKGNKAGAIIGMSTGFLVWLYTLILPTFARSGWITRSVLENGPFGIGWLAPEHLFGVTGLDPASHAVLWTMFFNIGLYVLGSLYFEQSQEEQRISEKFVNALAAGPSPSSFLSGETVIYQAEKKRKIEELFSLYFSKTYSVEVTGRCLSALTLEGKNKISIVELAELNREVEKSLASSIGAAAAHSAIRKAAIFSSEEEEELRQAYADIMTKLRMPPSDLLNKIDYYREKERLLTVQAIQMEETIQERDREIVQRRLVQEALAEEKERLAVTLRSIGDGVITTDTEGRVVMINNAAELLTGWKQEAAAGRPLTEIFHIISQRTRKPCKNPFDNVINSGGMVGLDNHTVLVSRDGTERNIADSGAPIRDSESRIIGVVLVFRDVTDKERMEAELLRTQKLESVGILAGGIAHDFNNILTSIIGNISLAKLYSTPGDRITGKLEKAERASLRARDLTQQLLTFSKGGAPVRKAASIAEILKESARFVMSGSNVLCNFSIADDLLPADIDEGQINQVINNLLINAQQSMPGGGIITIRAENATVGRQAGVTNLPIRDGEYIIITIRDQGPGIPDDHLGKIFDPYFTTKQHGSGLGLTTTYAIIKKHEGHIFVESQVRAGTTFSIYLPASAERPDTKQAITETSLTGGGRILLMDDEEIVRDVGGSMLVHLGYDVAFARDGDEAINHTRKAAESGTPFDVVIMDLTIPGGMGGKDAIQRILAIDTKIKAIASSGYSNDPVMAEFKNYGFSAIVPKPYKLEDLRKVLQQVTSFDQDNPGDKQQ